jgi:hypothetical protein
MNSRERVVAALEHRPPDYVPLDLGGCGQTGINASTLYKLRAALGLSVHPIPICEPFQLLGQVEPDLIEKLGVDVVPLWNRGNLMGNRNLRLNKPWTMPDGTPVLMDEEFEYDIDSKGYTMVYPQGDRNAPYSLQMPPKGSFFDNIERAPEPDENDLRPLEDFRDSFTLRTEVDCEHWERTSKQIWERSDLAILGVLGGMGLGDAAEVPGPFLKHPQGIRSYAGWLEAHVLFPEYIQAVYELQTEVMLRNLELYRQAVGDRIQAIWLSGTDFGTQNGTLYSLATFRALYAPYYRRVNDWIHKNTKWKTFYHTCGSVESYIPDFIDMGMDILNPVQCSAKGMEAANLKARFGDKIVFWGGGVDTQDVLPMGTPEEVYRQVRERIDIFSPGGGYVFSTIHNIVSDVPTENILAMYRAVADSRKV